VEKNVRRDMVSTLKNSREQMQQALRRDLQAQQRWGLSQPGRRCAPLSTFLACYWEPSSLDIGILTFKCWDRSGVGPSQAEETVRTAELDNRGILQLQRHVMTEQDTELAELEKTVGSTKVRHTPSAVQYCGLQLTQYKCEEGFKAVITLLACSTSL
jgi:hypothetical protein